MSAITFYINYFNWLLKVNIIAFMLVVLKMWKFKKLVLANKEILTLRKKLALFYVG